VLEPSKQLYRYTNHLVGDGTFSWVSIYLSTFLVVRETPKGYWLTDRWVSKTSTKRYAHDTKEKAWASFQARKKRQIKILQTQLKHAIEAASKGQPQ